MKEKEAVLHSSLSQKMIAAKEYLAREAMLYIPKVIELLDRNPISKTYGCFDRQFWHYRTSDFPSGMYQEYVLPLALVYTYEFPNNPYYQEPRLREWVIAGIDFASKAAHPDGSCDDYYPFEKALGAAAFSLYAASESYLVLGLDEPRLLEFFKKRAEWLMRSGEIGRLSNHHALVALCLWNLWLLTGEQRFQKAAQKKIRELISWQSKEGWFPEYEGCDPGYLSICVDFLAKFYQKSQNPELVEPLGRAFRFMTHFLHPDGSYGGEYGSRNTFHFFPHGLEIVGKSDSDACALVDAYLAGAGRGLRASTDDDRIFGHLVYNYLQAYLDFNSVRPKAFQRFQGSRYFPESGLYVRENGSQYFVTNVKKGGVFKYFSEKKLTESDTGVVIKTTEDRVAVSQIISKNKISVERDEISVSGFFYERADLQLKSVKFLIFRIFLLTFGRLSRNLTRFLLQRKIILGKKKVKIKFTRCFRFNAGFSVEDMIEILNPKIQVAQLAVSSDLTSIYVATSQPYQSGCLKPWHFLNDKVQELNRNRIVSFSRQWS
ncbi:MAG: hypothetical protein HZC17_06070 [Candidatus Omnitrophica bacterium]|nr:hypothetical protein [Candidatus Omnitrophota bacterium]